MQFKDRIELHKASGVWVELLERCCYCLYLTQAPENPKCSAGATLNRALKELTETFVYGGHDNVKSLPKHFSMHQIVGSMPV